MPAHIAVQAPGSRIGGRLLDVYTLEYETAQSAAEHFRRSGYRAVIQPGSIVHVWDTAAARADRRTSHASHAHGRMGPLHGSPRQDGQSRTRDRKGYVAEIRRRRRDAMRQARNPRTGRFN